MCISLLNQVVNLRTLYLFHKRNWPELFSQIKDLEKVGFPHFQHTSEDLTVTFPNPIEWEPTEEGSTTRFKIKRSWLEKNVLTVAPGQDIVVFHIPSEDWKGGADNAHCYSGYGKPTIICVHSHEGEMLWNNPAYLNKGLFERVQHEFAHAKCDILGVEDLYQRWNPELNKYETFSRVHEIEDRGNLWKKEFYQHLGLMPSDSAQKIMDSIAETMRRIILDLEKKIATLTKAKYIIIHHTGGTDENPRADTSHHTFETVDESHRKKWNFKSTLGYYIGYHYFIEKDGKITQGRADDEIGAHTLNFNDKSIGICLAGNFDVSYPTAEQEKSLRLLLKGLQLRHNTPYSKILPHRKFAQKSCYGWKLQDNWAANLTKS